MFLIDVEMSFECCEILRIRPHPHSQLWLQVFKNYQYESPAFFLLKTTVLDVCSIYIFLIYNNRIIFKGSLHSGYLLKGQCQEISSIIVHCGAAIYLRLLPFLEKRAWCFLSVWAKQTWAVLIFFSFRELEPELTFIAWSWSQPNLTGAAQKSGGSATLVYDLNFELKTIYKVPVLHIFFCINITAIHPLQRWARVPGFVFPVF